MKIAIICVGVFTLCFRTVPPHGSSNKTRVNRAMPHHRIYLLCSFVILVILSFISGRAGEVESLDLRSSRALIFSNISVGTCSVLSRCRPEGMWCEL